MKRLGKFTGKVYDENYDFSNCPECCVCISEEQAKDEKYITDHHMKDLLSCLGCMGCPAAMRR